MTRARLSHPAAVAAALLTAHSAAAASEDIVFIDATERAGIQFRHENAATDEKYMIETMGSGGGLFDYDGDGDLDVYLLNGAFLPGMAAAPGGAPPSNVLYRNDGNGRFTDRTEAAGVGDTGYGMGMAAADFDNDGDIDLYVTNYGENVFYRNEGDGTFTDITDEAGVAAGGWSTSAAFGDVNGDGFLELFVCRYVKFTAANHKFCGNLAEGFNAYCHPDVYDPEPSLLFMNQGDGTFRDATEELGVLVPGEGKSLGVVWNDFDNDGDQDIYVANDSMRNFLFQNEGGRFEDVTLLAGVGYSEDGRAQAGMGTDAADVDGDGFLDLFVTNLDFENNALYRGSPTGIFLDDSYAAGLAEPSLAYVGFGTVFFDYDLDGWPDLFVANGHIIDNIDRFNNVSTYREQNFVFRNRGDGSFEDETASLGDALAHEDVARGAAAGDVDRDGDADVLITRCGDTAVLLSNEGGNASSWLSVRLVGRDTNRDGVGARVTIQAGGRTRFQEVKAGSSYLAQSDLELLFGLGDSAAVERLEVRWSGGGTDVVTSVGARQRLTIVEGLGAVSPLN